MLAYFLLSVLLSLVICLHASHSAEYSTNNIEDLTHFSERGGRSNLVSFKTFGNNIQLGMEFLMPVVKVPTKRQVDNDPALLNINIASVAITGVLAGSGLILGQLFKLFGNYYGREDREESEPNEKDSEGRTNAGRKLTDIFEPIKLIYTNSTGAKTETRLSSLWDTVEQTFLENDIDISSCMQKSICSLVYKASQEVRNGDATAVQKIIDGVSSTPWLLDMVEKAGAPFVEAMEAGKLESKSYCDLKYENCKWSEPEENLMNIFNTYVKFT